MNFSLTPYSIYDIPVSASEPIIWMLLTDTDMWILIRMNGMSQLYINLLDFYTDLNKNYADPDPDTDEWNSNFWQFIFNIVH